MSGLTDDPRLDRTTALTPDNAVAAIITIGDRYLLQLRDRKHGIFFPDHWGCFGGGVEPDEALEQALIRELNEELSLELNAEQVRYFTRFEFDLGFARLAPIWRVFYEVSLEPATVPTLTLGEGSDMRLFGAEEILTCKITVTPYDAFALWFHINRNRLIGAHR
ncbi:NUDIX domain-containing protein [Pseudolabrys taiwanensis]|uniref:NUDIX domain-containing protein n=1 Tax=Pseudolabrys taiwanensis TaxID=331696 RepID=UPI0013B3AD40|nr:NUDIX domain-containing protein [Pseudolabrys taiwanensis]